MKEALENKVLVLQGTPFFPTKNPLDDAFLRLSFARLSIKDIHSAVSILSKVIHDSLK